MKKILLILIYLPMICLGQFNRLDASTVANIENTINLHQAAHNWVGMSVGIIMNGEIAYLNGFGLVDKTTEDEATEFSVYRVASNTKSMTSVMILKLAEMGLLSLEDYVQDHVPEYPNDSGKDLIKIKHLLSHTSGVHQYLVCSSGTTVTIDYTARNNYIDSHGNYYDPVSALDIFKDEPLCFSPPGTNFQYTTWGYCLLAAVIENASGSSYQDFFYDNIVCPMKMPMLQIEFQDRVPYPYQVTGYQYTTGASCPSCPTTLSTNSTLHPADISYKMGGGGSIASVIDMALYMKGLVDYVFIDSTSLALMGTSHQPLTSHGYGFKIDSDSLGNTVYRHGGDQTGTSTYLRVSPITKNGVVIMFNTEDVGGRFDLSENLYNHLFSATLSPSPVFSPINYSWNYPSTSTDVNPGIYESNYSISSNGQINSGDFTQFKAKNLVELTNGFHAEQGSFFRARINCD